MRPTRDQICMAQAMLTSLRSTCGRKQVGAVIAQSGRPISSGYAGPPAGFPHCTPECAHAALATGGCRRTIHAEQNALAYAARYGISTDGATLYSTLSPCLECAKLLINSGIKNVWYYEEYRMPDGIQLLRMAGITCEKLTVPGVVFTEIMMKFASGDLETPPGK